MAPDPRPTFRAQVEEALGGFAVIGGYLLFQVARRTEVRTDGDRVLVTVCAIGAGVCIVVLTVLVVRAAIRRLRMRAARDADAAAALDDTGRSDDSGRPGAEAGRVPTRDARHRPPDAGDAGPARVPPAFRPAAAPGARPRGAQRARRRRGGPRRR